MRKFFLASLITILFTTFVAIKGHANRQPLNSGPIFADGEEEIAACCDRDDFSVPQERILSRDEYEERDAKFVDDETYRRLKREARVSTRLPRANLVAGAVAPEATAPIPAKKFDGIKFSQSGGFHPPDTVIAAGPDKVLQATNAILRLSSKLNSNVVMATLDDFFKRPGAFIFDPKIYFDVLSNRFFVVALERNDRAKQSFIHLAISQSSSPSSFLTGWCRYKINSKVQATWADFPSVGMNGRWLAINVVNANFSDFRVVRDWLRIIDKKTLVNNSSSCPRIKVFKFGRTDAFIIQAAQYLTDDPTLYLLNAFFGTTNSYGFWKVTGSTKPVLEKIIFQGTVYSLPPEAAHPKSQTLLNTGDTRLLQAVFRNGRLFGVLATGCSIGTGQNESCIRFLQLDPGVSSPTSAPVIISELTVGAGSDKFLWMPSLAVNKKGNVLIATQHSGKKISLSTAFSGLKAGAAQLSPFKILAKGTCPLADTAPSDPRNRTGDYTGAQADPADNTLWIAGEYAQKVGNACQWGTTIARINFN